MYTTALCRDVPLASPFPSTLPHPSTFSSSSSHPSCLLPIPTQHLVSSSKPLSVFAVFSRNSWRKYVDSLQAGMSVARGQPNLASSPPGMQWWVPLGWVLVLGWVQGTGPLFLLLSYLVLAGGESGEAVGCGDERGTMEVVNGIHAGNARQAKYLLSLCLLPPSSRSWGSHFPKGVEKRFGILPLPSALN